MLLNGLVFFDHACLDFKLLTCCQIYRCLVYLYRLGIAIFTACCSYMDSLGLCNKNLLSVHKLICLHYILIVCTVL